MRLFTVPLLLLLLLVILSLWTINVASAARFVAPRPRPASADVSSWKDNQELLNVHLIPHSHCDPGWLYTVEQYYQGAVRSILNSVTEGLAKNPDRRFIWVETSFFSIWWSEISDTKKAQFRQLLQNRQIEFIIGGWVMNDHASTTYHANIDQMTHGHRYLKELFGDLAIPRVGWDIDPFGASQANARMYKEMGFDYLVYNRVDYRIKEEMINNKTLEFNWKVSNEQSILSHILYHHYSAPDGFDFEGAYPCCAPDHSPPINERNIEIRAYQLVSVFRQRAQSFRTNHLLVPFGDDFEFRDSEKNFSNMTLLIQYINNNKDKFNINVKYSLLSEYFDSIKPLSSNFPRYDSDFFPYADNSNSYWTGYFTSRPQLKHLARTSERIARSAEALFVLSQSQKSDLQSFKDGYDRLNDLRSANGYVQHHDGITGTERTDVVQMYTDFIVDGLKRVSSVASDSLSTLTKKSKNPLPISYIQGNDFTTAPHSQMIPLVLFNSLGWSLRQTIRLYTSTNNAVITDSAGRKLRFDTVQLSAQKYEIVFETIEAVPAVGYSTYFLQLAETKKEKNKATDASMRLSNPVYDVTFCSTESNSTRICSIKNKVSGIEIKLDQNLMQYDSMAQRGMQNSGAYIFKSDDPSKTPVSTSIISTSYNGQFVQEIHQYFSPYAKQIVRLYNSSDSSLNSMNNFVEICYEIGEMPEDKELVTVFSTNIASKGKLYTDNNGYTTLERTRRNEQDNTNTANFYPIVSSSHLKDDRAQLTILADQSRGIASLQDGQAEVMLHRRTSMDDGRGLGRPLDDTSTVFITLRLMIESPQKSVSQRHSLAHTFNYPVDVYRVDTTLPEWNRLNIDNPASYAQLFYTWYSAVHHDLPSDVHLMSLQADSRNDPSKALFRLHHIMEENEPAHPESVQVQNWFSDKSLVVSAYKETYLSGNHYKESSVAEQNDSFTVSLNPSQIRTFALQLKSLSSLKQ